eukprot:CAMPEP_0114139706 /NCGR_PEP_ID=MMETSP0043_2-20121206/16998_1 /TAXON_ID=464988 /ORGANISM="Hemiselmis andersenii, Strain CCMP644" /LENGTH=74 /DNA_ID=CAMNT_0001233759 /DNA_START=12 /DNA_END=236 /DNA_ORIENTATION=+
MFNTIRQAQECGRTTEMLVAQYFAYDPVEGGKFGTGVSKGAYYCADTATPDECKEIVQQVATWQYADIKKSECS